jgi:hypothetical protein
MLSGSPRRYISRIVQDYCKIIAILSIISKEMPRFSGLEDEMRGIRQYLALRPTYSLSCEKTSKKDILNRKFLRNRLYSHRNNKNIAKLIYNMNINDRKPKIQENE